MLQAFGAPHETAGEIALVIAVTLPMVGIMLSLLGGRRAAECLATLVPAALLVVSAFILATVWHTHRPLAYVIGGWFPPLGITLRADGPSVAVMTMSALVTSFVGIYAREHFRGSTARAPYAFFVLLPAVCGGMNLVCLGGDLFTLYVALELLTFAAVPLVSLDCRAETLQAALRYLLFALFGAIFYLLGTAMLYSAYATLDMHLLSHAVRADPLTVFALALMTTGLLAKTALFPLHLWLPPAHAGAPAPASALLSALVVKGSFFLVLRLWFDVMPALPGMAGGAILGTLGAAAIIFGGLMALRQQRLKLLIAYSTVAQIGYLFLTFPLALDPASARLQSGPALAGGLVQLMSHAAAKAAMFLAAGSMYATTGHDRVAELAGVARKAPISLLAFAIGGLTLAGLPPGGAFLAKSLLSASPAAEAQWWWEWVMAGGSVLTSAYLVRVVLLSLTSDPSPSAPHEPVLRPQALVALLLALTAIPVGNGLAVGMLDLLMIGRPPPLATPGAAWSSTRADIWKALAPVLLGALLAFVLLRHETSARSRRSDPGQAGRFDRFNHMLSQWSFGSGSLLFLTLALGAAILAGH